MKKLTLLFLLFAAATSAQRFDILAGKLENIKGISAYNVTFDYTAMEINGFKSEAEFVAEKMKKREKSEGGAAQFREDWYANRVNLYEPAFISYFNKMFKDGEVKIESHSETQYTMDVKTTWIYPGYNAGTDIEPAKISATITIKETANPANILLVIAFEKSIGLKHNVMTNTLGERISWAYEKLVRNLALQMKRFL